LADRSKRAVRVGSTEVVPASARRAHEGAEVDLVSRP